MSETQTESNVTTIDEQPETRKRTPRASKKKAAKKAPKKAKGKAAKGATGTRSSNGGRLEYRLAAGVKVDEYDAKTHKGAIIHALKKIGSGNKGAIMKEVERQGKIETEMKLENAIGFMLWELTHRDKKLVSKPAAKAA